MELRRATEFLSGLAGSSRYRVEGHSMTPALANGQQVLAKPVVSGPDPLLRGTIVVLRHPGRLRRFHIKRVVGLPRENVSLREGVTYVNGRLLAEPYLPGDGVIIPRNLGEWILADDEYFVMGGQPVRQRRQPGLRTGRASSAGRGGMASLLAPAGLEPVLLTVNPSQRARHWAPRRCPEWTH